MATSHTHACMGMGFVVWAHTSPIAHMCIYMFMYMGLHPKMEHSQTFCFLWGSGRPLLFW